jgi:hypothetical protein
MIGVLHEMATEILSTIALLEQHRQLRHHRTSLGVAPGDKREGMLLDELAQLTFIRGLVIWKIVHGFVRLSLPWGIVLFT